VIGWLAAVGVLGLLQAWTGWWGWVAVVPCGWALVARISPGRAVLGGAALGGIVWLGAAAVAWSTGSADGVRRVAVLLGPLTLGSPVGLFAWTAAIGTAVAGTGALVGVLLRRPEQDGTRP
jgi:hypothetical protein